MSPAAATDQVQVPVIDLSQPEGVAAEQVRKACVGVGFFYVCEHGVSEDLIADYFEQNRKFFSLPTEEKLKVAADSNGRGYTAMSEEKLDPATQKEGDSKEGLYFGRETLPGDPESEKPLHGPNQWPSEEVLPDYRRVAMEYFTTMRALAMRLIRLLALALELPPDFFDDDFEQPMLFMRPLHYSARISNPDEGIFGAGAHSDYGMLTLLATDDNPGLQIRMDGRWHDVVPKPGTLIVNLGDMLERWSNGKFRSTMHRVVNSTGRERHSIAYFVEPDFNALVECLPTCCIDTPAKYPPITGGQHLLNKYAATHSGFDASRGTPVTTSEVASRAA